MPYVRGVEPRCQYDRILEWVRTCRSALYLAEKTLIEVQYLASQGKDPRPTMRAGSHHVKMAREALNTAVTECNDICRHWGDHRDDKEYAQQHERADLDKIKATIKAEKDKEETKNELSD